LFQTKDEFQLKISNIQGECLWRIKDAEELIKTRITAVTVDSKLKELNAKLERLVFDNKKEMEKKIATELSSVPPQLEKIYELTTLNQNDTKQIVNSLE